MKAVEIREGDIVEIDYITEFTKEHINEGKALVIWKGCNNQPLVRKLDTKTPIWSCYEHISKVVGHIDIEGYMDRALSAEPCEDAISRQAVEKMIKAEMPERGMWEIEGDTVKETVCEVCVDLMQELSKLPSVTPKEKSEYEHDHEVVKAYNDGQAFILDKIKAEVELLGKDYLGCPQPQVVCDDVIKIIDKYRGDTDGKDSN